MWTNSKWYTGSVSWFVLNTINYLLIFGLFYSSLVTGNKVDFWLSIIFLVLNVTLDVAIYKKKRKKHGKTS